MNIKYFFPLVVVFLLTSCAHMAPKDVVPDHPYPVNFEADVVDPNCPLQGNVVIEPFKSGDGVFANDEVSQASLMMVKGFADLMQKGTPSLHVIIDEQTDKANFFIKGYITVYQKPEGMINRLKKKHNVFAVEGKMINLETNRVIIRFSSRVESAQEKNLGDFAYRIGERLAQYFLDQKKGSP